MRSSSRTPFRAIHSPKGRGSSMLRWGPLRFDAQESESDDPTRTDTVAIHSHCWEQPMKRAANSKASMPEEPVMRAAIANRDRRADGAFVYGVLTTGVYCRPSCASRAAKAANIRFFGDAAA